MTRLIVWMLRGAGQVSALGTLRFDSSTPLGPGGFQAQGGGWEFPRQGSSGSPPPAARGTWDRSLSPSHRNITAGEAGQEGTKGTAQTLPQSSPALK